MKRWLAFLLTLALIAGLAGCSTNETEAGATEPQTVIADTTEEEPQESVPEGELSGYTAGTYTGSAEGLSGSITVEVVFSETQIEQIQVTESNETDYLMKNVSEIVPARILEEQSLAVDTVTGATFASRGLINAVAECVEQAGGDVAALSVKAERETVSETMDADVVVVGAGLAGLMTAAVLKDCGVENVVLIEKQGVVGGSAVFSAGQMYGALEEENLDYVRDTFMKLTMAFPETEETKGYPNPDKVDVLIQEGYQTFEYFRSKGLELAFTDMTFLDSPADTRVYMINPEAQEQGITSAGETLVWTLQKQYEDMGGKILLETNATDLIVDESGAVTGLHAETKDGVLTINAKYTVICTGSAGRGQEALERYMPTMADGEVRVLSIGSDGSGILMMADIGAAVSKSWLPATAGIFTVDPVSQLSNSSRNLRTTNVSELYVDHEGIRRCAEFAEGSNAYYYMEAGVEDSVYTILDGPLAEELELVEALEEGLETYPNRVFKADSIEELAALAGLPADTLAATIATYNSYCEAGEDKDFGKPADQLIAIDEAPYYVVRYSISGKDIAGGVVTDTQCQVLREDGTVIEGLYACGFAGNRDYYGTSLVGSVGLQTAVTGGRLAAQSIADKLER